MELVHFVLQVPNIYLQINLVNVSMYILYYSSPIDRGMYFVQRNSIWLELAGFCLQGNWTVQESVPWESNQGAIRRMSRSGGVSQHVL